MAMSDEDFFSFLDSSEIDLNDQDLKFDTAPKKQMSDSDFFSFLEATPEEPRIPIENQVKTATDQVVNTGDYSGVRGTLRNIKRFVTDLADAQTKKMLPTEPEKLEKIRTTSPEKATLDQALSRLKSFGQGASSLVKGVGGGLSAIGGAIETEEDDAGLRNIVGEGLKFWGSKASEYSKTMDDFYKITDRERDFADDVIAGVGTMSGFLVPGLTIPKLIGTAGTFATAAGVGISSFLESFIESGNAYESMKGKGATDQEAQKSAGKSFGLNMLLTIPTNALGGFFGKAGKEGVESMVKKGFGLLKGAFAEGAQEGIQEVIGAYSESELPKTPEELQNFVRQVLRASGVGAVIGGGVTSIQTLSDKVSQSEIAKQAPATEVTPEDVQESLSEPLPKEGMTDEVPISEEVTAQPERPTMPKQEAIDIPQAEVKPEEVTADFKEQTGKFLDKVRVRLQDKFLPVARLQEAVEKQGGTVPDEINTAQKEEIFQGKIRDRLDTLEETAVKPLKESIGKSKQSVDDLEKYLYAKHAPKRNEHIGKIRPDFEDPGSGMTNEEAQSVLDEFESQGKTKELEKLSKQVYKIVQDTRSILKDAGLVTQEELDAWTEEFGEFYVPLKGQDIQTEEQRARTGRGFDIRGRETKRALGRKSKAKNILANVIQAQQEAIVRAEKNEVGKAFLNFARQNPNTELYEIVEQPPKKPTYDKRTGEVVERVDQLFKLDDNVLSVKENGQETLIKINDPALARSMKNLGVEKVGKITQAIANLTRFYASINTARDPGFVVSNFLRDINTVATNIGVEDSAGFAKKIVKETPTAINAIRKALRKGDVSGEWGQSWNEFKKSGGKVEFINIDNIEQKQKRLLDDIADIKKGNKRSIKKFTNSMLDIIDDYNSAVENGARLAYFKNLRDNGVSPDRAAALSKNLTVNFNKKGEIGSLLNSYYMFANAGIQGSTRMLKTLNTKKGKKLAKNIVVGSALLAELNRFLGGKDDDNVDFYDKIPEYIQDTNLILMNPFSTEGDFFRIPLPYGYNAIYAIGNKLNKVFHGENPIKQAGSAVGAVANAFNPLGGEGSFLQFVAPTFLDLSVQLGENKNFWGGKIKPEQSQYGPEKPDSQLKFKSARPESVAIAETLNEWSGGSAFRSGKIDISPEVLDHVYDTITGGTGRFIADAAGTIYQALESLTTGKKFDRPARKIPFVRRVVGNISATVDSQNYYDNINKIKQIEKEYKSLPPKEKVSFRKDNRKFFRGRALKNYKSFEKKIKNINKSRKTEEEKQKSKLSVMKQFNKLIRNGGRG